MKKFILGLLISIITLCGFSFAQSYWDVTTGNSMTSCNSNESLDVYYYLTNAGYEQKPSDTFGVSPTSQDALIVSSASSIKIWRNGVISKCNDWARVSNVVAASDTNGVLAVKNMDNCKFNIPSYLKTGSNATAVDAQIHFTIGYWQINNNVYSRPSNTRKLYHRDYCENNCNWTCYPGGETVSDYTNCTGTFVRYSPSTSYHTGECLNYRVFRCGDGLVNGRNKNGTVITSYSNGVFSEECDPNASGWNSQTCNPNTCQIVQQTQPQCSSQYNGQYYYSTGTSAHWLNANTPGLCTNGSTIGFETSWQTGHSRHFTWSCTNGTQTVTGCIAYQNWCGNGRIDEGHNESCDEGLLNGQPNHCNLACTGIVPPPSPLSGLSIEKEQISTGSMEAGATVAYKIVARNTGSIAITGVTIYDALPKELQYISSSISIVPTSSYHFTHGTVNIGGYTRAYILYTGITLNANGTATVYLTGKVKNGQTFNALTNCAIVSGTNAQPQEDCVTVTPPTPPTPPAPYFLKQQRVGNTSFTTSDITVHVGDIIQYKLNFGNLGTTPATGKVRDVLPSCLQYLTSSIVGVSSYNFSSMPYGNQWIVMYKDMPLAAGQTGYMLIQAKVKGDGQCANTTTYVNVGHFTLNGTELTGDVVAKRPKPYVKKWQRLYDTDQRVRELLHVNLGQTIQYKVDFRNDGSVGATGEVKDLLPNCVKYLGSSLSRPGSGPITGYEGSNEYVKYSDIYLAPGQSGYMLVLGLIQSDGDCQSVTGYLNTGMFHFIGDSWMTSIVVAEREPSTTVEIVKEVTPTTVRSGDIVTYTITYTNHGPETLNSYTIVDNWPSTKIRFLTGSSARQRDNFVDGGSTLTWYYNNQNFASGDVRTIIITGQVLSL